MNDFDGFLEDPGLRLNRRHFFGRTSLGLGSMALASLLSQPTAAGEAAVDIARPARRLLTRRIAGSSRSRITLPRPNGSFTCS